MRLADSFTMCQTAFTVMPSPHALPTLVHPAKHPSSINCGCGEPNRPVRFSPNREPEPFEHGLPAHEINNGPMLFALLEMIQSQSHGFMPP